MTGIESLNCIKDENMPADTDERDDELLKMANSLSK